MGIQATVVFTDMHGSTSVFEALGNVRATDVITQTTSWIAAQCESHGGHVVKTLGDGVLAMFNEQDAAIQAVVSLQRLHHQRLMRSPVAARLPIRIGVSWGDVEMVAGDCYGDAVNVASRLCDLCGPHQIWASAASLERVPESAGVSFRPLGAIAIRGRAEPCNVSQVEWREEDPTDFLTMQGQLDVTQALGERDIFGKEIELSCMGVHKTFKSFELPAHIGRVKTVDFMVSDPRVSRTHACLEWRNGSVVFVDLSSYGSWIRFEGDTSSEVLLRRAECVLHGKGELALGAPFSDLSVPTVSFAVR